MTAKLMAPGSTPAERMVCDVLVVGGGINGAGIARDLAGRGYGVTLCERDDLAAHTSSSSTKLIHGGLRYLEHREFALVRKALQERERLMRSAPHLIRPLRFLMPHDPSLRPAWMIRIGLLLYDHLAHRDLLPASAVVDLRRHPLAAPLGGNFRRGFAYSDAWADDARLVIAVALDAARRGARILPRTPCIEVRRDRDRWRATLVPERASPIEVEARVLVNAAGPWAATFLRDAVRTADGAPLPARSLRLVKGSHIVVPRLFDHDHAYLLQGGDRRIVFAIPYEGRFTLVGTTEVDVAEPPARATIGADEIDYLCQRARSAFRCAIGPADVVWHYAGVRPLLGDVAGDPGDVTRDYRLEADEGGAPLVNVWGGKLTTFRRLGEEAATAISRLLGDQRRPWTEPAVLPGGDLGAWVGDGLAGSDPPAAFARFRELVRRRYPWLEPALAGRLAAAYGTQVEALLGDMQSAAGLGAEVAPGLHERELAHLVEHEWASEADDALWRRSKLGLHLDAAGRQAVARWFDGSRPTRSSAPGFSS